MISGGSGSSAGGVVAPDLSPVTALLTASWAAVVASCTVSQAASAWSKADAAASSKDYRARSLRMLDLRVVTILAVDG